MTGKPFLSVANRAIVNSAFVIGLCLPLAALPSCGRPESAGRGVPADVVVTFDGPADSCAVAKSGDASKQSMPCLEVPSYLVKTLKLPRGSFFDYETIPNVNVADFEHVISDLKAVGYRLTPGVHVNFLTEPKAHQPPGHSVLPAGGS